MHITQNLEIDDEELKPFKPRFKRKHYEDYDESNNLTLPDKTLLYCLCSLSESS